MFGPDARRFTAKLPLAVILLAGAFVRFHHLAAYPLRWDELLVPMASHHSLRYIFDLCSSQETHPPLFYLLTKVVLLASAGDGALRFLSALSGTAALYLLYRLTREFVDTNTALFAAAFLSLNILHIDISRELRPYSIQTTLFWAACWFLARLIKNGNWINFFVLCSINILLFWLHYFTFYMIAAQGVILTLALFTRRSPVTFEHFVAFCMVTLLVAIPISVWFVLPSLAHQLAGAHLPRQAVLHDIGRNVGLASFFIFIGSARAAWMYALASAGWVALFHRKPRFALFCLMLGAIPFAIVLGMAPGYSLHPWHVAWITPFVSLCAAAALSWLPGPRVAAPLLALGGALFILAHHPLYETPTDGDDFRAAAAHLAPLIAPGALVAEAATPGFINALSWYLDQSASNPLAVQRLLPGNSPVALQFVSGGLSSRQGGAERLYVRDAMGEPGAVAEAQDVAVYTFQVNRQPVTSIDTLPATFSFSSRPKEFYGFVSSLSNVKSVPLFRVPEEYPVLDNFRTMEGGIVATQNNQPAFFEFVLKNNAPAQPIFFSATLHSFNIGAGNQISLSARFDDEPPMLLVQSFGPDPDRSLSRDFSRRKPFTRLALIVEMYCKDDTAQIFGDNLRTLVFQGLSVTLSPTGDGALSKPLARAATPQNGERP